MYVKIRAKINFRESLIVEFRGLKLSSKVHDTLAEFCCPRNSTNNPDPEFPEKKFVCQIDHLHIIDNLNLSQSICHTS